MTEKATDYWKILIVDDNPEIHGLTRFALKRGTFLGKGLAWLDAYSAREAEAILETERDVAVMLVDVMMESDDAGLKFIEWHRNNRINPDSRIILRSGTSFARNVIIDYDLHDYKTKNELTNDKLFTAVITALRAYSDRKKIENARQALENIIKSTAHIMRVQTMYEFARTVLAQISNIFEIKGRGLLCAQKSNGNWDILAESGAIMKNPPDVLDIFDNIPGEGECCGDDCLASVLYQDANSCFAVYLETDEPLTEMQQRMLLLFCHNVSLGLSNIRLYDGTLNANRVTVMSLAQVTESRDRSTGEHVFRMAKSSEMLAKRLFAAGICSDELTPEIVSSISLSATLHDLGKISIPDAVLLKDGRLSEDEFRVIKEHPATGARVIDNIIKNSCEDLRYLSIGKDIALNHHERWDGTGYPNGLAGKDIPVAARITAVTDVFDALTHARCYKPSFSFEDAKNIIADGAGTAFDPEITALFLSEVADAIRRQQGVS
ncbi:MAG: DUF3369 domain-containing protein [Clostridiales Family XIII bacterium]|nr:DUF3369 domain-containing protein [Clostridiales Family XIII bacterium]